MVSIWVIFLANRILHAAYESSTVYNFTYHDAYTISKMKYLIDTEDGTN